MDKLNNLSDNQKKGALAAGAVLIIAAGMYFMSKSGSASCSTNA